MTTEQTDNADNNLPTDLPIIVMSTAIEKKDTALEKEIKKFNQYIETIFEYEQEAKRIAFEKEQLDKLVGQKIIPQLVAIAASKVKLIQHTQNIIQQQRKISKLINENFIAFAITMLSDATQYSEPARELYNDFVEQQHQLLSKKQQKVKDKAANKEDDTTNSYNNFNDVPPTDNDVNEEYYYDIAKETAAAPNITVKELYKTLAKMLHPDMEQQPERKAIKEALMQQLTAAKDADDLMTMLQLKKKAHELNATTDDVSFFSIEKIKAFNKVLRQKLLQLKNDWDNHIFGQAWRKATNTKKGKKAFTPQDGINKELKDLKRIKKSLEDDIKNIHDIDDVEFMLLDFMNGF